MSQELDALAKWALESYAHNRDSEEAMMLPLLTVVGGDYDTLTAPAVDSPGDSSVEVLAFLIGYVGYPCDAVYLTCTWEAISVEADVPAVTADLITPDELTLDQTARTALVCWAHSIPTSETVLFIMHRHLHDDGSPHWIGREEPGAVDLPLFAPLAEAAHAYDSLPIQADAHEWRQAAMRVIIDLNGNTHDSLFYEPGTLLATARNHG
jgi:hypothetical protein